MTDRPLTRTLQVKTGYDDKCDGCARLIPKGTEAYYRLDGALFHDAHCATVHDGIPLDLSGAK